MEPHEHIDQVNTTQSKLKKGKSTALVLNIVIVVLLMVVGYFSYAFMTRGTHSSIQDGSQGKTQRVIQLDVLNGCRIKGAAAKVTNVLRAGGFDVVEMKNYKTSNVHQTVVVDRVGDLSSARRVAQALGVPERNIVQQLNPDYFVDVSVIIGEDFPSLKPLH